MRLTAENPEDVKGEYMKGYKVFNPDWTCKGFKYEVGKKYHCDGEISCCTNGFHFCTKLADCFNYYELNSNNKVAEIEASGDIDSKEDDTKHCASDIEIIREITWHEVLDMINEGNDNTGMCNTGYRNTGNRNTGNWNTGDCNTGYRNTGDCNTGNRNTGDWNKTNNNTGCFMTEERTIEMFNKPSGMTYADWERSMARNILFHMPQNIVNIAWTSAENMSDAEKEAHPEFETIGGYLHEEEIKADVQSWWDELSSHDKETVMSIPNFDADIFFECTGIRV